MTGLTQALAAFVAAPTFGSNEQGALAVAKTGFMDTIATMLAGHNEPVVNIVRQFFGDHAPSGSGGVHHRSRWPCA
jgi:2-methylcitrate dehydratase PrpD